MPRQRISRVKMQWRVHIQCQVRRCDLSQLPSTAMDRGHILTAAPDRPRLEHRLEDSCHQCQQKNLGRSTQYFAICMTVAIVLDSLSLCD